MSSQVGPSMLMGSNGLPATQPNTDLIGAPVYIYDEIGTSAITGLPKIASGAYSDVYKYADLHHTYAIKLCEWDAEENGCLFREFYSLMLLQGHPNIPRLYAVGLHKYKNELDISFHMNYVEDTLQSILPKMRSGLESADDATRIRAQSNATAIAIDIIRGLKWMHECGLLHCDIKPANILIHTDVDSGGHLIMSAQVCDFSISIQRSEKYHTSAVYTEWQRPPEIHYPAGSDLVVFDTEADVYALGWTVLSILTGSEQPAYVKYARDRHIALCKYYGIDHYPRTATVCLMRLSVEDVYAVIARGINLSQSIWVDSFTRVFAKCCVPNPLLRPIIVDIERDLINICTTILEPSGAHPRIDTINIIPTHPRTIYDLNEYSEQYTALRRRAIDNNIRCPEVLLLCAARIFRVLCKKNNIQCDDTLNSMIWMDAALFAASSLHFGSEISFIRSGIVVAPDHIIDIFREYSWIY